jgi:GNAT superfamily N-acetyltransferase
MGGPVEESGRRELLTVGVAPGSRGQGLGAALLESLVTFDPQATMEYVAEVTLAERDPVEPLDRSRRADVARRLLERAGFQVTSADPDLRRADPGALTAVRPSI